MPELFDGTEGATAPPDPNPKPDDSLDNQLPAAMPDLGVGWSLLGGLVASAGYIWLGFPILFLASAVGAPIAPPDSAAGLYLGGFVILWSVAVAVEITRRVRE